MDRAFVIKGPETKAVLFAQKSPNRAELRSMNIHSHQLQVEQVILANGHPLKGAHVNPTLYVFCGQSGKQDVFIGTQPNNWGLSRCNKDFADKLPFVQTILTSCLAR